MSNLTDFLQENGISPDAVVAQSKAMESYSAKDREQLVARAAARRAKKPYAEVGADKVGKLGRGVTHRTMKDALEGKPIPKTGRQKITRAVNALLTTGKKDKVETGALFGDAPARKGKKK